jgi:hypothetical protein
MALAIVSKMETTIIRSANQPKGIGTRFPKIRIAVRQVSQTKKRV